jgi:hypothetical protein
MDRLEEQSPEIGEDIIILFEKKFGQNITDNEIARPSNMNLRPVEICTNDVLADMMRRRCSATPSQNSSTTSNKNSRWAQLTRAMKQAATELPREIVVSEKSDDEGLHVV